MDRPQLRPEEAFPAPVAHKEMICLRDPSGLAETPIFLHGVRSFMAWRIKGPHFCATCRMIELLAHEEILVRWRNRRYS